jgi:hypothetical protein
MGNEFEIWRRNWFDKCLGKLRNEVLRERLIKDEKLKEYELVGGDGCGYIIEEIKRNEQVNVLFNVWVNYMFFDENSENRLEEMEGEKLYLCLNIMDGVSLELLLESEIMVFEK